MKGRLIEMNVDGGGPYPPPVLDIEGINLPRTMSIGEWEWERSNLAGGTSGSGGMENPSRNDELEGLAGDDSEWEWDERVWL
jgi:hypothetical protein